MEQVAAVLPGLGEAGAVRRGGRASSYKDIQRMTGLSLATISKFHNGGNVLPENREAIERAVVALDFRPNEVARGLRLKRTRTVGVLLPVLDNAFHQAVIAAVEEVLRDDGITVIVSSSPTPVERAVDALMVRMVDGIVAIPSAHDVEALRTASRRVPVVLVDRDAEGITADRVFLDNRRAGLLAARHLMDHGHRHIALVGGEASVSSLVERAEGFEAGLAQRGLTLDPGLVSQGPLTVEQGYRGATAALQAEHRPTALCALNYELSLGAVIALNDAGLRLGQDMSVLGFDAADAWRATVPRLSVVEQPVRTIAQRAAEIIRLRLKASHAGSGSADETADETFDGSVDGANAPVVPLSTELLSPRLSPGGSVQRISS